MLLLGYNNYQNAYEGNQPQAATTYNLTSFANKNRSHPCRHYITLVSS